MTNSYTFASVTGEELTIEREAVRHLVPFYDDVLRASVRVDRLEHAERREGAATALENIRGHVLGQMCDERHLVKVAKPHALVIKEASSLLDQMQAGAHVDTLAAKYHEAMFRLLGKMTTIWPVTNRDARVLTLETMLRSSLIHSPGIVGRWLRALLLRTHRNVRQFSDESDKEAALDASHLTRMQKGPSAISIRKLHEIIARLGAGHPYALAVLPHKRLTEVALAANPSVAPCGDEGIESIEAFRSRMLEHVRQADSVPKRTVAGEPNGDYNKLYLIQALARDLDGDVTPGAYKLHSDLAIADGKTILPRRQAKAVTGPEPQETPPNTRPDMEDVRRRIQSIRAQLHDLEMLLDPGSPESP